ncbi:MULTISPECIES: hypothetical protein [Shewanella]|uniref:hypothetical protein n=1 Tax=Shewanella TaxID=22 RepID=UPI00048FB7FE|nr:MULTISPECIES: hypothetical protein [Shewanella]QLE83706.1 hypothetical protein FLM48_00530 [Shewanella sp. Scap07]
MKPSNIPRSDDDIVGLLPPLKAIVAFLSSTMLMIFSITTLNYVILATYTKLSIEPQLGYFFGTILVFCGFNFAVTRGSFFAATAFNYYMIVLFSVFLPSVLFMDAQSKLLPIYLIGIVFGLLTFYALNNKYYQAFVQYQFDAVADQKEALAELAAELAVEADADKKRNQL